MRPETVVLVVGTGTEVGKTWVAAHLLRRLRQEGVAVAAAKPVQSFSPGGGATDAELLAAATGQAPAEVCPLERWYPLPMAPPIAAEELGLDPFGVTELVEEIVWPDGTRVGVVEAAGGVRSPIAADGDPVELARRLEPDAVLLVADADLGTINAVRLSASALEPLAVTVVLNRYASEDAVHERNRSWLMDRDGLDVVVGVEELAGRFVGR